MCGEYWLRSSPVIADNGSSPHVWGILINARYDAAVERFIPTCVGNTTGQRAHQAAAAVHPHMCGEYFYRQQLQSPCHGSSPHVWGIRSLSLASALLNRFIPTCVGNTLQITPLHKQTPVHPHMCGEYSTEIRSPLTIYGSSPHVWGIPIPDGELSRVDRFIPTCVGNTFYHKH